MGPSLLLKFHILHPFHYFISLAFSLNSKTPMALASTTVPSTFSSEQATAAASAASNSETRTMVTGYPLVGRPGGYPQIRTPPPPTPIYLHQLLRSHNQNQRVQKLGEEQASPYRLAAAALCFFFVACCLFFTLRFFFTPRLPQAHLVSANLSPIANNFSVACNVFLLLTNPNRKLSFLYDSLELFVIYQPSKVHLFKAQFPPFVQPQKNDTVLRTQMEISNVSVGNDVVEALKGDLVRGSMSFEVQVLVLVSLVGNDWKTGSHLIKVYCDDVILGFSSVNGPGNMINPYKDCRVEM